MATEKDSGGNGTTLVAGQIGTDKRLYRRKLSIDIVSESLEENFGA